MFLIIITLRNWNFVIAIELGYIVEKILNFCKIKT
jgi:hypothetical protein